MAARYALIESRNTQWDDADVVATYLPDNYEVIGQVVSREHAWSCVAPGGQVTTGEKLWIVIAGEDYAGWTLDGYVIPRLGSGVIVATEVTVDDPRVAATGITWPTATRIVKEAQRLATGYGIETLTDAIEAIWGCGVAEQQAGDVEHLDGHVIRVSRWLLWTDNVGGKRVEECSSEQAAIEAVDAYEAECAALEEVEP